MGITIMCYSAIYTTTPTINLFASAAQSAGGYLGNMCVGTSANGASIIINGEDKKVGGNCKARYITRRVTLADNFESGDLRVYLTAYRPVNTDINVYYKILSRNDTQNFDDGQWQLMTMINSGDSTYSQLRSDVYEYTFAPGTNNTANGYVTYTSTNGQKYTSFSQFAIKIVLTTTDKTAVPFVSDMRALALPANVNTTV